MKSKYIFDINKFCNNVKDLDIKKELDEVGKEGHRIISTIANYIDCSAEFLMSITHEGLERALEIANIEESSALYDIAAASRVKDLAKNTETLRKVSKKDLF